MASDTQDSSRRKHRRSDDDESEDASKRRKHHHHRRRRHHHRHSSRKHEEDESKHEPEDIAPLPPHPPVVVVDYDMEEGEIVDDDEGYGAGEADITKKKSDSDVESGEIKPVEVPDESVVQNLGVHAESGTPYLEAREELGLSHSPPLEESTGRDGRNAKTLGDDNSDDDLATNSTLDKKDEANYRSYIGNKIYDDVGVPRNSSGEHHDEFFTRASLESHVNGDIGHLSREEDNRVQMGSESYLRDERKSVSSESTRDKYKTLVRSPSRETYHNEVHTRSSSKSRDHARERSRSQSILREAALLKTTPCHEGGAAFYADNSKVENDSDDERKVRQRRSHWHGNRDLMRDEERERSTSYSRYTGREDRHHSREARDRDTEGREMDRDRKMEKDQDKSRDREIDRDMKREKEWDRGRDREMDRDTKREKVRDRMREREMDRDRDRKREKERDRSRDREMKRDRKREKERDRNRDRVREGDRDRERERENDRDRVRDRIWERERESERDRNRDKGRDTESDRVSRHHKYENRGDGYGDRDSYNDSRRLRYDETEYHRDRTRKDYPAKVHNSKRDFLEGGKDRLKREEDEQEDYQDRVTLQLAEQEEEDLNRIKEESRRRRQDILEKYKTQQLQQQLEPHSEDTDKDTEPAEQPCQIKDATNVVPEILDGRSDGADVYIADPVFSVGKSPPQNGTSPFERTSGAGGLGEGTPKSERSDDMFCDDIFGESPAGVRKSGKADGLPIERSGLHDNWDDADGYYSYRFGEILDGRYEVTAAHGKGVFSTVVRAKDLKAGNGDPEEVAIKMIRNNDTMQVTWYKAGLEELVILKKLVGADPEDRRHCVRFLSSFKYRNHLCLVFESLHMNLREVLKKFGRNIGLKLSAVGAYAKQLFVALKHLRNCGVLHCDIKPDNMLVNEAKNVLKLCDFGNAMFAGKNEITPYLVSRFYRAPEIILGLPYDHPLDIWSVGCCLYEIYTGKVLFPGPSNNDMLRLHMELKGPFPKKMLRKGAFTDQHFDRGLNFHATEDDPVTKKTIKRLILNIKPKDIGSIVMSSPGEDPKMLANFKDLLEKVFVLDPEKRMTVSQALSHPFITGK